MELHREACTDALVTGVGEKRVMARERGPRDTEERERERERERKRKQRKKRKRERERERETERKRQRSESSKGQGEKESKKARKTTSRCSNTARCTPRELQEHGYSKEARPVSNNLKEKHGESSMGSALQFRFTWLLSKLQGFAKECYSNHNITGNAMRFAAGSGSLGRSHQKSGHRKRSVSPLGPQ